MTIRTFLNEDNRLNVDSDSEADIGYEMDLQLTEVDADTDVDENDENHDNCDVETSTDITTLLRHSKFIKQKLLIFYFLKASFFPFKLFSLSLSFNEFAMSENREVPYAQSYTIS